MNYIVTMRDPPSSIMRRTIFANLNLLEVYTLQHIFGNGFLKGIRHNDLSLQKIQNRYENILGVFFSF